MGFNGLHWSCIFIMVLWWQCGESCKPLHLTSLIDQGKISTALELSEVKDPLLVIPKSYAGFITTDREHGNHLFFWFFPSTKVAAAPLVVWLNGGPGISSMFGLLYENGPVRTKKLDNGDVVLERRPQSWAEPFSMLYIDNPVGTGYSYSETNNFKTKQEEYSQELYVFLEQFYLMFPQFLHRELYIGGQSYAGKYVPAFAHQIHTRILANESAIPLTGIYLGGPYFDPLIQSAEYCEYFYAMGAVSRSRLMKCKQDVKELADLLNYGGLENKTYYELFKKAFPALSHIYPNNYVTLQDPDYLSVSSLMTSEKLRKMLHVCDLKYNVFSGNVQSRMKEDFLVSTKSKLADLMNSYKVLLYTGDYDGLITSPMVEAALMTMPWSHHDQYNNSLRSVWKMGINLKGFYTRTGQFCRVVVHGAGHQTPHDQPESSLEMMIQFVQHGCLQENMNREVATTDGAPTESLRQKTLYVLGLVIYASSFT